QDGVRLLERKQAAEIGRIEGRIELGGHRTTICTVRETERPVESVIVMIRSVVPETVGVPLMTPSPLLSVDRESPVGSAGESPDKLQKYGSTPRYPSSV